MSLDVWRKVVRQGHKNIPTCCLYSYTPEKPGCHAAWILTASQRMREEVRGTEKRKNIRGATEMWPQSGQEWPAVHYNAAHQDDLRHENSFHWRSISWNSSFLTTHPTSNPFPTPSPCFLSEIPCLSWDFQEHYPSLVSSGRKLWWHRDEETSLTKDRRCVQVTGVSKTRLKQNYQTQKSVSSILSNLLTLTF